MLAAGLRCAFIADGVGGARGACVDYHEPARHLKPDSRDVPS
jgi:hypothetical protein